MNFSAFCMTLRIAAISSVRPSGENGGGELYNGDVRNHIAGSLKGGFTEM